MNPLLYLADSGSGGDELPLQGQHNVLLPAWYDVVWSLVCFVVVLFVFAKYVIPMFKKVLAERTERIEGGIAKAEAAQAEAKAALDKYNAQLAEARNEAARIRDDARVQGQQILADMKTEAQTESDRIVAAGNHSLTLQRQQIVTELRGDLGRQAVDLAEKLVGHQLSESTTRSGTIDAFLADLDKVHPAGQK